MRKKNRLYTANKWNQNLFAEGGYNFDSAGLANWASSNQGNMTDFYTSGLNNSSSIQNTNASIQSTNTNSSSTNWGAIAGQVGSTVGTAFDGEKKVGGMTFRRGAFDAADPLYYLAGSNHSAVGDTTSDVGIEVFKAGANSGNPWMMLAGGITKGVGSLINAGWGHGENKAEKQYVEQNNQRLNDASNYLAQASTTSDILNAASMARNKITLTKDGFSNGWFNHDGDKAYNEMVDSQDQAYARYGNSLMNGARNVDTMLDDNVMRNFAAYGGPLDMLDNSNSGAINYEFMSDYLTSKNTLANNKNNVTNTYFSPVSSFALGGDMQSNSADFSTGLTHIDAGKSHEENPYDGVQVGISSENGKPNLVEEGETIFDDYVFSKRMLMDSDAKKRFHINKKSEISYADESKKIEKEASERPNDAISQQGLTKQLHDLADEQERQKAEMQAKEAQEEFAQLPPEQQAEIMQQIEAQQNMQSPEEEQQVIAENQPIEETPEEVGASMEQQIPQQQEVSQGEGEVEGMAANGGKINKFDRGGEMKKKIYSLLPDIYTDDDFAKWAKQNNVGEITDWEKALDNEALVSAIGKTNPRLYAFKDALSKNYDFGTYTPLVEEGVQRGKQGGNYVVNSDGSISEIYNEVPSDWISLGNYKWSDEDNDNTYNYYQRPIVVTPEDNVANEDVQYTPVHKATWGRQAGLTGPLVGLGMMAAGIGKPDYSRMGNALAIANQGAALAHYQPIGNYLTYRPMDIWQAQNRMDANSRATDRAIMNSSGLLGTKIAGLVANSYNSQLGNGDIYSKALAYNDALRKQTAEFNRATDLANAQAYNQTSATNAGIINANRQQRAQMAMEAALQKMNADAGWYNSLYGNVNNYFKGLGQWGKENEQFNTVSDMFADGLAGTVTDKSNIGRNYVRIKANGGKINRKKRGLTI